MIDAHRAGVPRQKAYDDAKCGFACHSTAEAKDFVFTAYGAR
jgi:hypothetical protein